MSQRNSETDGMAMGLALVGAAFIMLFLVLYAVACFCAIVLSILAFCALEQPLTIYKWTITQREARIFLGSGITGLIGLPVFVIFCAALFQFKIQPDWWGYILLGGYSLGALGLGGSILDAEQNEAAASFIASPPALPPPTFDPSQCPLHQSYFPPPGKDAQDEPPGAPGAAFRFASWDDEEAR